MMWDIDSESVSAAEKYLCDTKALLLRANLVKHDLAQRIPAGQGDHHGHQGQSRRTSTQGGFFGGIAPLHGLEAGMMP